MRFLQIAAIVVAAFYQCWLGYRLVILTDMVEDAIEHGADLRSSLIDHGVLPDDELQPTTRQSS